MKRLVVAMVALLCPWMAAAADGGDPSGEARDFVAAVIQGSTRLGTSADPRVEDRTPLARRLLNEHYDMASAMRTVLGRYWDGATVEQKERYLATFEDFLLAGYGVAFERAATRLRIAGVTAEGERIVVHSVDTGERGAPRVIDWVVVHGDGQPWLISDVRVGGISLLELMRQDFSTLLRNNKGDMEDLLAAIRRQTDRLKNAS